MSNVQTQKKDMAAAWQLCLAFVLTAVVVMLPDFAAATNNNTPIGNIFCTIVGWATGNTGKGLATIAITVIGVGALLGKVSWGMALIVALGIALVFGAAGVVDAMGVDGMQDGCRTDAEWPAPPTP
jgi:type IV secretion system protein VirB2